MKLDELIVVGLATWRVSRMLMYESGPLYVFTEIREKAGIRHDPLSGEPFSYPYNSVFQCIWCMSVWVGLTLWVAPRWISSVAAASAIAAVIEQWHERQQVRYSR